jgi:hypothetical protein
VGQEEEAAAELSPEALAARLEALLQTCTHTVFAYAQRGLFDRDKLTFTLLLTTQILLKVLCAFCLCVRVRVCVGGACMSIVCVCVCVCVCVVVVGGDRRCGWCAA